MEQKLEEKWVEFWDYPNYEISNLGNVRNAKTQKLLSCRVDGNGYRMVSLWSNKKVHTKRVGRYNWMSHNKKFCSKTVDHINDNQKDDRIENLQCISLSENYAKRKKLNPIGSNKYNVSLEDKLRYQQAYLNEEMTSWDIHRESGLPLNYVKQVLKRGTWDKLLFLHKIHIALWDTK